MIATGTMMAGRDARVRSDDEVCAMPVVQHDRGPVGLKREAGDAGVECEVRAALEAFTTLDARDAERERASTGERAPASLSAKTWERIRRTRSGRGVARDAAFSQRGV